MPVVNLPASRPHSTISPAVIQFSDQVPLLLTLTAALMGPIAILTLIVSVRRSYKTSLDPVPAELLHPVSAAAQQQHPWSSKQSREVAEWRTIMPSSRKSEIPSLGTSLQREDLYRSRHKSPSPDRRRRAERTRGTKRGGFPSPKAAAAAGAPPSSQSDPSMTSRTTTLSFQDRRLSSAASNNGDYDPNFSYHHGSESNSRPSSESTMATFSSTQASSPISLRRSYSSKVLEPPPLRAGGSLLVVEDAESEVDHDAPAAAFSPSSFPSSSPILPLAPHASFEPPSSRLDGAVDTDEALVAEDDVATAGWQRHTRVYGGGVCLACLANGTNHDDEGGYYGDNVPMDQRR